MIQLFKWRIEIKLVFKLKKNQQQKTQHENKNGSCINQDPCDNETQILKQKALKNKNFSLTLFTFLRGCQNSTPDFCVLWHPQNLLWIDTLDMNKVLLCKTVVFVLIFFIWIYTVWFYTFYICLHDNALDCILEHCRFLFHICISVLIFSHTLSQLFKSIPT